MPYRVLADLVVLLHFAYMLFAIFGGLLVLRWWGLAWLHLPAVIWAAVVELYVHDCPLTPLENALLARAGLSPYSGDFINHYMVPVIYPPGLTPATQSMLGILLLVSSIAIYLVAWRLHRRRRQR